MVRLDPAVTLTCLNSWTELWLCLSAVCCSRTADLDAFEKQHTGWFIRGDSNHYLARQPGTKLFPALPVYEQEWQCMLSSAAILGVKDCMPNCLEQVDNIIACLCNTKTMATAVNRYFRGRSHDGKGVQRHLITYEDAMEALTVIDHKTGPSPTQGCYAHFNSSPTRFPKPAATKPSCSPIASLQITQPVKGGQGQQTSCLPKTYPRCLIPDKPCWQCGLPSIGTARTWNTCDHACLNCGGPSHHAPGGHKTDHCLNPRKGPHNLTFWSPAL